jgi:hypothetical protein
VCRVGLVLACGVATVDAKQGAGVPLLERFLARAAAPPVEYRALRHLEAQNDHFGASGWMDAWTEFDQARGFTFQVIGEGGSSYIRKHVLLAALEGEQRLWASREPQRASVTLDNYSFQNGGSTTDGLEWLSVKPKRKDVLLVDGSIFVQPADGELTRIEGRLSKAPSFWTRRVEIVRQYQRIGGVRVPVAIESVAHVLIAGRSTFRMTYEYETINGQRVGTPQPPQKPQTETVEIGELVNW